MRAKKSSQVTKLDKVKISPDNMVLKRIVKYFKFMQILMGHTSLLLANNKHRVRLLK